MELGIFGVCGNVGGEKLLNVIKFKSFFKKNLLNILEIKKY